MKGCGGLGAGAWCEMNTIWPETPGQRTWRWRPEWYEVPSQAGAEGLVDAAHLPVELRPTCLGGTQRPCKIGLIHIPVPAWGCRRATLPWWHPPSGRCLLQLVGPAAYRAATRGCAAAVSEGDEWWSPGWSRKLWCTAFHGGFILGMSGKPWILLRSLSPWRA